MDKFSRRSADAEIMDDLTCSGDVVNQTLRAIDTINRRLGGNSITLEGINTLLSKHTPKTGLLHIADIGCGSGEMLKLIDTHFNITSIRVKGEGFDANPSIIEYARKHCAGFDQVSFHTENIMDASFRARSFDIITATLFLHHFSDDELVSIIRQLAKQARVGVVINDLHRHPVAYYSIKLLASLFSGSPMFRFDAPLSVLRGFKRQEWVELLARSGITRYTLRWKWAFRWQVIIPVSQIL